MFRNKQQDFHQQQLREMRIAHEAEKDKMRQDHLEQIRLKDDLIKDMSDRLMSRDLFEKEQAKTQETQTVAQEDDPYVELEKVTEVASKEDIENIVGNDHT